MTAVLSPVRTAAADWTLQLEPAGRVLLAALLVFAPIPLGGAAEPARSWLLLAAAAVAGIGFAATHGRDVARWLPPSTWLWLCLLAVPAWQLLPLGGSPVELLGGAAPTHGSWVPAHSWARAGELAAAAALFVATARLCDCPAACRRLIAVLLTAGVLLVGYGLLASAGLAPLLDESQTRTVLVATFVNRNHTANLLIMVALLGLGFVVARAADGRMGAAVLAALAVVVALVGVVATASRGALLALVAGAIALPTFAAVGVWNWRRVAAAVAIAAIAALWLLPAGVASRFSGVGAEWHGEGARPAIWRGALGLWQTAPWFGTGLGTFGDLSPATQVAAVPGRIEHAHCDPLEFLVETGLVGAAVLVAAVAAFFVRHGQRCRGIRDRERARLGAGALAALVAFGVHALVEFPLQIPANLLWAAAIAGLGAGVLRPRRVAAASRLANVCVLGLVLVVAGIGVRRVVAPGADDGLAAVARGQALLVQEPAAASEAATAALTQNAFSSRAHRLLAMARLRTGDADGAREAFARALAWTNPADRPQHQLAVAIDCLRGGAPTVAAAWLHDLLPRLSTLRLHEALAALYTALPAVEALLPLLPSQPAAVRRAFADVLLRRGDFAGREAVLASLGEPAVLATLADGLGLVAVRAEPAVATDSLTVPVELEFAGPALANGIALVLRCDGPTAAVHRPFRVDGAAFRHVVRLDPTFPPGRYELGLDFRRDAPAYPLASVVVPATPLRLRSGVACDANELYWATAVPDRRARPSQGLPLRPGDVAFRVLVLPDDAGHLVVETTTPTRLRVTFDGVELPAGGEGPSCVHRAVLPARRDGELRLGEVDGDQPVLRTIVVTARGP